jgi:hypothetical protein
LYITSRNQRQTYVYWTMYHLDSWIKIDQLDVICFIISLLLNMFRMLVHPSSGACDLLWIYFTCCIALVWCALKCFSLHKDTTPPQPNHSITPTHNKPEQYNTWNKSTISRKLLKMDVLTSETCWAVNGEIIKRVTLSWSIFIQLSRWCTVQYT